MPRSRERYAAFTEDMVDLVLGHGGTLKAEHGTGRIMAPYVRRQFGDALYEVMVEVKRLLDPGMLLNPGVLLNEDPRRPARAPEGHRHRGRRGRPVRGVRLLRAGLPEQGPDHHAPPAHRAAPRT